MQLNALFPFLCSQSVNYRTEFLSLGKIIQIKKIIQLNTCYFQESIVSLSPTELIPFNLPSLLKFQYLLSTKPKYL